MQREIHICIAPPPDPRCELYNSFAYLNCEVVDIYDRVKGMRDLVLLVEVKLAEHGDIPHVRWDGPDPDTDSLHPSKQKNINIVIYFVEKIRINNILV